MALCTGYPFPITCMKKQIRKIYTRTGDKKKTEIAGGMRISKHAACIEAVGSLDELNSFLGFLLSLSDNIFKSSREKKIKTSFKKIIEQIQKDLFVMGANLSRPLIQMNTISHLLHHLYPYYIHSKIQKVPQISHHHVEYLDELIDHFHDRLPPLKNFILPQGNPLGTFLQVVRAVCRRTERRVVQLSVHSKVNPFILAYLNRLSDLFFMLARAVNYKSKKPEIIWEKDLP